MFVIPVQGNKTGESLGLTHRQSTQISKLQASEKDFVSKRMWSTFEKSIHCQPLDFIHTCTYMQM